MEHTPSMLSETHTQRILDLASQRGLLRASDLDAIGSPRCVRAIKIDRLQLLRAPSTDQEYL